MNDHPHQAAFYRGDKTFAVEPTTPATPAPGEVAIRVAYCGICGTDMHVFHGNMDARVGLNRVIGHEMSGVVEAVGEGVDTVEPSFQMIKSVNGNFGPDIGACPWIGRHVGNAVIAGQVLVVVQVAV